MKKFFFLMLVGLTTFAYSDSPKLTELEAQKKLASYQDRANTGLGNPLKNVSKINFFPYFPAPNKSVADKICKIVNKELNVFGKVNTPDLIVKNGDESAVDLSSFIGGLNMVYQIKNVMSAEGENLGIIRASLNLEAPITIQLTKEETGSFIWSANCFLKGNTDKDLENLIEKSLPDLLKQFSDSYSKINSNKPVFNLYTD